MAFTPRYTSPTGFPDEIALSGEHYPLHFTTPTHHRETWAHIIVDGEPMGSLSLSHKQPYRHSLERAEAMLASYRRHDGKYYRCYPTAYGIFDSVGVDTPSPENAYTGPDALTEDMVDDPAVKIDVYCTTLSGVNEHGQVMHRYRHQLQVVLRDDAEAHIAYSVICPVLFRAIVLRYNQRKQHPSKITADSHNLPQHLCM